MLLFFDTISPTPKIALIKDNSIVNLIKMPINNNFTSTLIIKKLINIFSSKDIKNKIEKIVVCTGPGSYTTLRVGIASAIGLKIALGIELIGISAIDLYLYFTNLQYIKKNKYFIIQSSNNQNFIVAFNKYNKLIYKPKKLEKLKFEPFHNNEKNSILISNEKIDLKLINNKENFELIKNLSIVDTLLLIDLDKIKKEKKIIKPLYFSSIKN